MKACYHMICGNVPDYSTAVAACSAGLLYYRSTHFACAVVLVVDSTESIDVSWSASRRNTGIYRGRHILQYCTAGTHILLLYG